jgi:hypothetical protein
MGTNWVFENSKKQKIGHYDFLKYPFFYEDIQIKPHATWKGSKDDHFRACLLCKIYQKIHAVNKGEISFA